MSTKQLPAVKPSHESGEWIAAHSPIEALETTQRLVDAIRTADSTGNRQAPTAPSIVGFSLSLVLPCYNEEANIENTIRATQAWFAEAGIDGEIIVTNDGSRDGSLNLLHRLQNEMPNLVVVDHDKNKGYGAAIRSGCDKASKTWIAFMDSDGQFHAKDLARLHLLTGDVDYVTGIREKRADTFQRWLNSRMYNLLLRVLLGVNPADVNCGMKLFRRSIWKTIRPVYGTGALINGEMFYAMKQAKIAWRETIVPHYPRTAGTPTGANPKVILRMFKELVQLKWARKELAEKNRQDAVAAAG